MMQKVKKEKNVLIKLFFISSVVFFSLLQLDHRSIFLELREPRVQISSSVLQILSWKQNPWDRMNS